ncbi:EMB2759 protein [Hibiscus syriacus]|uniref:EMB2759 protein n=2 Tax=Hibiscus syriacus TaxID=106335 RepID=A0A6A3B1B0_HIBSY|nr:EMB2759 protein [Hibiscus syriacus]
MLGRRERGISVRHSTCLCIGAQSRGWNANNMRISAFKGSVQSDESGARENEGNASKSSIKVSYPPKDGEGARIESSKAHNGPVACASETGENVVGSPAIQKLFKKWIMMLRSHSPSQVVDDALGEEAPPTDASETQIGTQSNGKSEILKMVWCYFWDLNATIKIPLLIFVPWYLGVNLIYGAEVSEDLTPLWVFGPLIVALYIKMLRGLCAFYVFSFKQTVQIIKNLPTYYLLAYNYIARGKLKEDVRAHLWQPVEDMKNMDYKEIWRNKVKDFQEWLTEKYLDYVESIWPYYCRTIRFLKRANLI